MQEARGSPKPKRVERGIFECRRADGSRYYRLDFRDQYGRRVREPAGETLKEARGLRSQREHEIRTETYEHPDDRKRREEEERQRATAMIGPSFGEFAERFLREYAVSRKSDYYSQRLRAGRDAKLRDAGQTVAKGKPAGPIRQYFGDRCLRDIHPADLDAYRVHRSATAYQGRKVSASTVRKDLTLLGTLFRMAKRWGVIESNPALDVEKPREPEPHGRPLSVEEWGKVAELLPPTLRSTALFALATGSRLREVAGLRWSDVDAKGGFVYFTADNKTARSKRVKIGTAAKQVLADMERVRKEVARATSSVPEYVFVYSDGSTVASARARNRLSQLFRAATKTAGLPWASCKTLRTTAASWAEEEGIPVGETKALLGHADVRTTQRFYIRSDADRTAQVVSALDRRLSVFGHEMDTNAEPASGDTATGS